MVARLARFVLGGLCGVWIFDVLAPFSVQCGLACQVTPVVQLLSAAEAAEAAAGAPWHVPPADFDYQEGWSSEESVADPVAEDPVEEDIDADASWVVPATLDDDGPTEPEPHPTEPPEPEAAPTQVPVWVPGPTQEPTPGWR